MGQPVTVGLSSHKTALELAQLPGSEIRGEEEERRGRARRSGANAGEELERRAAKVPAALRRSFGLDDPRRALERVAL